MKVSYKWLKTFFEDGALPSVEDLEQKLMFHAYEIEDVEEVADDTVIDVDVLPNRAADSLSHRGIAREISTLFEIEMADDPLLKEVDLEPKTDTVSVSLNKDASCSYYTTARINGVKVAESPKWLRERIEAIGQKSINNVVDATNYVLFGLGQPTHVFDASKFSGSGSVKIGVRLARGGEKLTLLGGDEVELTDKMSVIVDAGNDTAVAVAGVKGGVLSEVTSDTTDIIVESAKFDSVQTRKTAQALKIRTDASARYENNVAGRLAEYGVMAVVELILDIAGGQLDGFAFAGELQEKNSNVEVSYEHVAKLLGAEIQKQEIENIISRLGFAYKACLDTFTVTAPFSRKDVNIPEDVIEEIGRVYGYSNIQSKQLEPTKRGVKMYKKYAYSELIRKTLAALGYTEVYLYSLRDSGEVKLLNSLASDKDHLRSNLADGLLESLDKNEKNMPLLGLYESVKLFEIGNVFLTSGEETHVCLGTRVVGTKQADVRIEEILTASKEVLEKELGIKLPEVSGGTLEFDLDKVIGQLPDVAEYASTSTVSADISYSAYSVYPFILRDIAVWTPEGVSSGDVLTVVNKHGGDLLERADLFDEFSKDERTSYAFHLVFQSPEKTLTDSEVNEIMQKIEDEMNSKSDWEVR